jgi:hypothetical protein
LYLLVVWEHVVGEVNDGYRALFDEYLDDMDGRRIIDELLILVDDAERAELEVSLAALDDRFFKATDPVDSCIWGEAAAAKQGYERNRNWWYFRIPTNLSSVEDRDEWP